MGHNRISIQTRFSQTCCLESSSAVCWDLRPCLPLSAAPGCSSDGGHCPLWLRPPWLRGRLFPAGSRWLSSRPCPGLHGNRRRFYGSAQRRLLSPLCQQKEGRTSWRGNSRSRMSTSRFWHPPTVTATEEWVWMEVKQIHCRPPPGLLSLSLSGNNRYSIIFGV